MFFRVGNKYKNIRSGLIYTCVDIHTYKGYLVRSNGVWLERFGISFFGGHPEDWRYLSFPEEEDFILLQSENLKGFGKFIKGIEQRA